MAAVTAGPLEIEILDPGAPSAATPGGAVAGPDVSGVRYEPPRPRPSRLEPVLRRAEQLERRIDTTVFRLGHRRALLAGGNPRHDSRVRQHVWLPFVDVRGVLLGSSPTLTHGAARFVPSGAFGAGADGALRLDGHLVLRASWPRLAVTITVEPWWRSRTVATLALRGHRRVRYPRRYFGAAHGVARALSTLVDEWAVQESNL